MERIVAQESGPIPPTMPRLSDGPIIETCIGSMEVSIDIVRLRENVLKAAAEKGGEKLVNDAEATLNKLSLFFGTSVLHLVQGGYKDLPKNLRTRIGKILLCPIHIPSYGNSWGAYSPRSEAPYLAVDIPRILRSCLKGQKFKNKPDGFWERAATTWVHEREHLFNAHLGITRFGDNQAIAWRAEREATLDDISFLHLKPYSLSSSPSRS